MPAGQLSPYKGGKIIVIDFVVLIEVAFITLHKTQGKKSVCSKCGAGGDVCESFGL